MSVLVWLIVPALVVIALISVKVWRERRPRSIEAGLREFQRGLDALDPANDPLRRRAGVRDERLEGDPPPGPGDGSARRR